MDINERNKSMRDFFNSKAEGFDCVHQKFMETKKLLAKNLPDGVKKILDLGGGTGMELGPVFEKFPDVQVTVVDISSEMLELLKKRDFAKNVTCICGDFFQADFGTGYDAVISTSSLHHFLIDDKKRLYRKVYDSLLTGGVFLNSDKIAQNPDEEKKALEVYYSHKDEFHCDTPLAPENEAAAIVSAGFSKLEIFPTDQPDYSFFAAYKI